jgi:hypothetical protein
VDERASNIFQHIRSVIDSVVTRSGTEAHFQQYVERYRTPRWGIFSDYVIGDRDRPSDTFVFTVAPLGMHCVACSRLPWRSRRQTLKM